MNIRIPTSTNDNQKYVTVKLQQTFDFLEVLSLKINQSDVYKRFSSDYGVIVGRVIANGGFGVPNAKVSIFIPLADDERNLDVINNYPYKSTTDTNFQGIRYNLLEEDAQSDCHKPIGTFPSKRKVQDSEVWLEIYDKYYKYTTTTNFAGDFMIFGVPVGNRNIHMDVDISNIGFLSVKPYDLIEQGYSENLFESKTTFKAGTDLNSLVQVQSRDYAVNVLPFWGDPSEVEVGINRVDFNLGIEISSTATFFGSIFTDSKKSSVRKKCQPRRTLGRNCDLATGTGKIEMIRRISKDPSITTTEYISSDTKGIDENGNWAFTIPLNLDRVITDEFGNIIPSEDPNVGIATSALVRFRVSLDEYRFGFKNRTANYLIPNMYNRFQFGDDTNIGDFFEVRWKKVYTVTNYIPRYQKSIGDSTQFFTGIKRIGECENTTPFPYNRISTTLNPIYNILCIIIAAIGYILNALNQLITVIIFDVILTFVCFVKHPFNSSKRGACRCNACSDLNSGLAGIPTIPAWSPPLIDGDGSTVDDRTECAICYDASDGSQTYSIKVFPHVMSPTIISDPADGTDGSYFSVSATANGTGNGALFNVVITGGQISVISCVSGGAGYQPGENLTFPANTFGMGSSAKVIQLIIGDLSTLVTVAGVTVDCEDFDYSLCSGLCNSCDVSLFSLFCNGVEYIDAIEWSECVRENLAEELGVVKYEFYNDWVIGTLYSFIFDYKVRFKKKGKSLELFCDYECRESSTPADPDDEHRRNVCRRSYIAESEYFFNGNWEVTEINPTDGRGLITEYNNYLYYTPRHDIGVNETNPIGLTVSEKEKLLFATNMIELGSMVNCDIDGEPFLVDGLESTSYQKDDGTNTLFSANNCLSGVNNINLRGITLSSQAGIDIIVAEAEEVSPTSFNGDDGTLYTITGSESGLTPDYDTNTAVIIFDRENTLLRRNLCEKFDFYGTVGVYSTTSQPTGSDFLVDDNGDTVEFTTDVCQGFDDLRDDVTYFQADNMPPYYMYFGIRQGVSALDKLRNNYFDNCIS
jgi:hypothetical protein